MGHYSVLVIGEDPLDQFDKFQRAEYAHPLENKYIVAVDALEKARADYQKDWKNFLQHTDGSLHDPWDAQFWRTVNADEPSTDAYPRVTQITSPGKQKRQYVPPDFRQVRVPVKDLMNFLDWVKKRYGSHTSLLAENEAPDFLGKHREGWIRVDSAGEVVALMNRTIPGGIWDWFECTQNCFKLKPGATGIDIETGQPEGRIATDYAGQARKGAIDFDTMRYLEIKSALERWDKAEAEAARGALSWERYDVLCERHHTAPLDYASPAWKEYRAQPAIEAMYAAGCTHGYGNGVCLDSREEYANSVRICAAFPHFVYIIKDGELFYGGDLRLTTEELNTMWQQLPDDALLTAASVHA